MFFIFQRVQTQERGLAQDRLGLAFRSTKESTPGMLSGLHFDSAVLGCLYVEEYVLMWFFFSCWVEIHVLILFEIFLCFALIDI